MLKSYLSGELFLSIRLEYGIYSLLWGQLKKEVWQKKWK